MTFYAHINSWNFPYSLGENDHDVNQETKMTHPIIEVFVSAAALENFSV